MYGEWFEKIYDCKNINFRLLVTKFKCSRFKMTLIAVYVPCNNKDNKLKVTFLRKLERTVEVVDQREKLIVRVEMNG